MEASSSHGPIHKIAARKLEEYGDGPVERVLHRYLLSDPSQRRCSPSRVWELLGDIIRAGHRTPDVALGVRVDPSSKEDLATIYRHNANMCPAGVDLRQAKLAPVPEAPDGSLLMTLISGQHYLQIHRAFGARLFAPSHVVALGVCDKEGRLSLEALREVDAQFAESIENGIMVRPLKASVRNDALALAKMQTAANRALVMGRRSCSSSCV